MFHLKIPIDKPVYPKTPYPNTKTQDQELSNLTKALQLDDASSNNACNSHDSEKAPTKRSENYHWMVYKQEEMPNYIYEAKKRLGIIKQPHIAPNIEPKKKPSTENQPPASAPPAISSENGENSAKKPVKHWQNWDNPSTPDKIREIRQRLGDDRYKRLRRSNTSLTTYESAQKSQAQRPQTSFEIKTETTSDESLYNTENNNSNNVKVTTTVTLNENEAASLSQALDPYRIPNMHDLEVKTQVNTSNVSYNPTNTTITTTTSGHMPLSAVSNNYFDVPNPTLIHTTATTLPAFSEPLENFNNIQPRAASTTSHYQNAELAALHTIYDNDNFMVNNENQIVADNGNENNEQDYYNVVPNVNLYFIQSNFDKRSIIYFYSTQTFYWKQTKCYFK